MGPTEAWEFERAHRPDAPGASAADQERPSAAGAHTPDGRRGLGDDGDAGLVHDDELLRALVASGTGTWRWTAATGEVRWDETMEALAGFEPGEFVATFEAWLETLHPDEVDAVLAIVDDAIERGGAYQFEHRVVLPDGSTRWLECRGEVTVDDVGELTGTVGCAIDITERKAVEVEREALLEWSQVLSDRLALLHRIAMRLAVADDVDAIGSVVVDLVETPNTAAVRALWLVDESSSSLAMTASIGLTDEVAEVCGTIPLDSAMPGAEAVRQRRLVVSSSVEDAVVRYPRLAAVARSTSGFAAVPLLVEDDCLGVIGVGFDGDDLPDLDVSFLESAAGHLAQALARVRLTEALERRAADAAAAADRERRRRLQLEFLGRLTVAAIGAPDHHELMRTVTSAAVPELGDWCTLLFIPEPGADAEIADAHVDPGRVAWAERMRERFPFDLDRRVGAAEVIRTATTQFIRRVDTDVIEAAVEASDEIADEAGKILEVLQLSSVIAVPLITKRGVVGAIQFVMAESGREYDEDDVALAEAAAGRIAAALDVLWLSDQHRHTASTLQAALLPPELPVIGGLDVAERYFPAGTAHEVGGDFYDLFDIDDGSWAIVVGDVCGTGPEAAAVTGIARHTVRAAARHGEEHCGVLRWVNDAVRESAQDLFCTAVYGTIERQAEGWRLRVCAAGHPLPVLRRASGETVALGRAGTLLGVFPEIDATTVEVELGHGDLVLFYTDGMTDLPAPYGIDADQVVALVAGLDATSADGFADALHASITARVADAARADDVALVVVRVASPSA